MGCGATTPKSGADRVSVAPEMEDEPRAQERTTSSMNSGPRDVRIGKDGTRSWIEGDVVVIAIKTPVWCGTHYDATTELDIVECWFARATFAKGAVSCEQRDSAACVVADRVLDGKRLVRCFGSMQTCGEQWIMVSTDVDYQNVQRCGVVRYLGSG